MVLRLKGALSPSMRPDHKRSDQGSVVIEGAIEETAGSLRLLTLSKKGCQVGSPFFYYYLPILPSCGSFLSIRRIRRQG